MFVSDPVKQKEKEERIKAAKERAAEERQKKLMELKESQQRAQEVKYYSRSCP